MTIAEQLPRGRHGLSREQVTSSQRARLLRAMAEAVSERGYAKTPVAAVLRRSGVSRETFYEQFANKEECFLAAYDAAAALLLRAMGDADSPGESGSGDPLDHVLTSYLCTLAAEPAFARTFLVEVYAAGPAALARRVAVQARFAGAVADLVGAAGEEQRFACEAVVGAVSAIVTQHVCAGRTADLPELHAPLSRFVRASLPASGIILPSG